MFMKLDVAVGEKQACQIDRFSTADRYINRLGLSLSALLVFCNVAVALQQPFRDQTDCRAITGILLILLISLYTRVHPPQ